MPPSRRQLLRSSALSLSMLGGCSMTDESNRIKSSETTQPPNRSETTTATTIEEPPLSPCGPGPVPDSGWPLPDGSPGRTNYAPTATGPTTKPTAEWSVLTPNSEFGYKIQFTQPTVADGCVYVGRPVLVGTNSEDPDEQYIYAYDIHTGEQQWRAAVQREPTAPVVAGDTVLVHDSHRVYAFEAASGKKRWAYSPADNVESVLPTADGILITSTNSDSHSQLESRNMDGELNWHVTIFPDSNSLSGAIAWANEMAYVPTPDHRIKNGLVAIDTSDGTISWRLDLPTRHFAPLFATSCAVFVPTETTLCAVKRDSTIAWSIDAKIEALATDGERVYVLDESEYLRSVAVSNGEQQWEQPLVDEQSETRGIEGNVIVDGETVYAGTEDGLLVAFSADDGSELWRLSSNSDHSGHTEIAAVDETLYTVWNKYEEDRPYKDHLVTFR